MAQPVKHTHKPVKVYYQRREELAQQGAVREQSVRDAFGSLLEDTARRQGWTLVNEQRVEGVDRRIYPDGTMRDEFNRPRGHWEAKDADDDLAEAIRDKREKGYPFKNIIFENTQDAILIQEGQEVYRADMSDRHQLAALLSQFYSYTESTIEHFDQAVAQFQEEIPPLAKGLKERIDDAHRHNRRFQTAFGEFMALCREALNPNLRREAVDEMLIQHMLTERLLRTVFDMPGFARRNVIAREVENVIDALTSQHFNRADFLGRLDYFYSAIEDTARALHDFTEKQRFINTVYERFFQGYSVKVADTHGIVYTPQEIVDFMCAAVEEVLATEFDLHLGDEGVHVLDPCTGTGNFVVNLLRRVPRQHLARAYREQFFANEVMLMPYYIAALNIEHEYHALTGQYEPFDGLCFVDTLDLDTRHLVAGQQMALAGMFTEENTKRVEREQDANIFVIIGNPPYNVGQINENDNNKNRRYDVVDRRVSETYAADSAATNKNALSDAYVKFFRWATDRLGERDGIVCFVSNNSFVDQIAFDGMRQHLLQDFTRIYHIDLHGNVRQNPKLSGTTHNVFGIQVGVGITVAVRSGKHARPQLLYHRVPEFWRKEEKLGWLETHTRQNERRGQPTQTVDWQTLQPDRRYTWLVPEHAAEFEDFLPIGTQEGKSGPGDEAETIFKVYGRGVQTTRDAVVYDFDRAVLAERVQQFIEDYNAEVDRWRRVGGTGNVDDFVRYDRVKWSRDLKQDLQRGNYAHYDEAKLRTSVYRPFSKRHMFFDRILNEEVYVLPSTFPTPKTEEENFVICIPGLGNRKAFGSFVLQSITSLDFAFEKVQCFPFYIYDEDGSNRRENITDWALALFRDHYGDETISKWDIFYYVYGLLHHPGYRARYADNLKRELPRLPFAPDFHAFAQAGRELAEWHLGYEQVEPYKLTWEWADDVPASFHVEKMRLRDPRRDDAARRPDEAAPRPYKTYDAIEVNDLLTLRGLPPEAFDYRLGNRCALEWIVDQYRIKTDRRSGITHDPNAYAPDDEQYIVRLIGQVVRVSVETVRIVASLPAFLPE